MQSYSGKGQFDATVASNRQVGERFYKLRLMFSGHGAAAFAKFEPGQFVQIDISSTALPPNEQILSELINTARRNVLLRRPFSFANVTHDGDKTSAELLYRVVGPATLRMTTLSNGDLVNVIGPLGKGFSISKSKKTALLVIGGMGAPPIIHLARMLTAEHHDIEIIALAGAKTAKELPFEGRLDEISRQLGFSIPEFAKCGVKSQVATDDGSVGHEGVVTDLLERWLDAKPGLSTNEAIIYACGPEAMLAKVAEIARERNIDCQISMERMMACGIGVCQSCAVECHVEGSNETVYKLCCEDGPVFDSKQVVFQL
jgi:dihydroorotate dehydrogenase electron transfer subunit